jgi:outer membrane protein assembly factor BamB
MTLPVYVSRPQVDAFLTIIMRRSRGLWKELGMENKTVAFLVLIAVASSRAPAQDNWPQFRGPNAAGLAPAGAHLPESWSTTKNVAWKVEIPGRGLSSPIVWGDRVFVTSCQSDGKGRPPKKGLYFGGEQLQPPKEEHRWAVYAVDMNDGKILWESVVHKGVPTSTHHIKNSYASETPVTDGERVYAYFGNLGVYCLDLNGKVLWQKELGSYKTRFGWGTAASPVLHKDRLSIVNDNEEKSFLTALDKKTGQEIWRTKRPDEKSNWATPFIWENEKRTEIVTSGTGKVRSYDLDGKLLWELKGLSSITIPTPLSRYGLLYLGSGYVLEKENFKPIYAIKPGASGDISLGKDETSNSFIAWRQISAAPYNPSFLIYGDYLYVLKDMGTLDCYHARTGQEVYKGQRLGQAFTSSPWAYADKVFCLSEDGDTYVVQAGPQFKLLGKNSLDEMTLTTPALTRDSLIIRTETKLYRIREGRGSVQK